MRRPLYLLAALMVGAVPTASAQARLELLARRDSAIRDPYGLVVQVRGLLDDSTWLRELQNAYTIQMHWSVQLWKRRFIGGAQPKYEWDSEIHAIPALKQYVYTDRLPGRADDQHVFPTLDALKAWLAIEVRLRGPQSLDPGAWYYQIEVSISRITQEELDRRKGGGSGGGINEYFRNLLVGGGPSWDQRARVEFTVPNR